MCPVHTPLGRSPLGSVKRCHLCMFKTHQSSFVRHGRFICKECSKFHWEKALEMSRSRSRKCWNFSAAALQGALSGRAVPQTWAAEQSGAC